MRIGIDARTVAGRFTGDRTYWRGLIEGLSDAGTEHEYVLYTRREIPQADALTLSGRFRWRTVPAANDRLWSLVAMPMAARADRIDVVHVQYTVSPLFSMPAVTTVHDISFRLFPDLFSTKDRTLLNWSVPASIRRARRVIAVSENTRKDIVDTYKPSPPDKVIAIPLAAGALYSPLSDTSRSQAVALLDAHYGLTGPFVLAVGVLQPRKNLPMLVKAFCTAKRIARFPHRLVIVGKSGWLTGEVEAVLAAAPPKDVMRTGYVLDEHLPLFYGCAELTCYPSLYEGFGLVPLEAMSCGCPVAVSRASSLPEVVGDAGVLLDPQNIGDWIDAIGRLLADPAERERLAACGLKQAAKFSWTRTALNTQSVYNACHNMARPSTP
jgi:glycosyltransferase involved in cell wall biosynthesis